jgi:putative membrane protein
MSELSNPARYSRNQLATAIALFFHLVGLCGILWIDRDLFVRLTPLNLLLCLTLVWWTHPRKDRAFYLFMALSAMVGFAVEVVGVNTGLLFGQYSYGEPMGPQWMGVPLIIGVNWFIIVYCCGVGMDTANRLMAGRISGSSPSTFNRIRMLSLIIDGALLATAFDWLMEPAAIRLGFWRWLGDGQVPSFNYLCWFFISALLLALFRLLGVVRQNKFAVHLLLIQAMFFLLIQLLLTD